MRNLLLLIMTLVVFVATPYEDSQASPKSVIQIEDDSGIRPVDLLEIDVIEIPEILTLRNEIGTFEGGISDSVELDSFCTFIGDNPFYRFGIRQQITKYSESWLDQTKTLKDNLRYDNVRYVLRC